jgi:hypothetical protein
VHGVLVDLDRLDKLMALANTDLRTAAISEQLNIAQALKTLLTLATVHGKPSP